MDWTSAQKVCEQLIPASSAHLATPRNAADSECVHSMINYDVEEMWIGIFLNSTGSAIFSFAKSHSLVEPYLNWTSGQPRGDGQLCVKRWGRDRSIGWASEYCSNTLPAVCQREARKYVCACGLKNKQTMFYWRILFCTLMTKNLWIFDRRVLLKCTMSGQYLYKSTRSLVTETFRRSTSSSVGVRN